VAVAVVDQAKKKRAAAVVVLTTIMDITMKSTKSVTRLKPAVMAMVVVAAAVNKTLGLSVKLALT